MKDGIYPQGHIKICRRPLNNREVGKSNIDIEWIVRRRGFGALSEMDTILPFLNFLHGNFTFLPFAPLQMISKSTSG